MLLSLLVACNSPRAPIREQSREFASTEPEIVRQSGPVTFLPGEEDGAGGRPGIHRVREGDTLHAIAFLYGIDSRELIAANNLSPPYTIYVDQELILGNSERTAASATPVTANTAATTSAGAAAAGIQRRPIEASDSAAQSISPAAAGGQAAAGAGGWQWPVADRGASTYRPEINNRLDIEAGAGESVRAAKDGEVVYSRPFGDDSSTLLIIRHSDRYLSAYTQSGRVLVETGERVTAGQAIVELEAAQSGPPMVYFNVQRDGAFVDPTSLLP